MADNVVADAGAGGATFATDDVAGVHYPITKLAHGALDTATLVTTGASALPVQDGGNALTVDWAGTAPPIGAGVEATALRVTLATDSTGVVSIDDNSGSLTVDGTVSVSGTVTVDGSAVTQPISHAALTELAGAINASAQMDVNIAASAATITVDSELTTADLDTGVGTDTRAVVGLVGSASGGGALIPGSATDGLLVNLGANNDVTLTSTTITGTVAVTQSGTWDEVGINDSGNAITVDWAGTAPPIGAGLEATALRVTLATDSTGLVSVDDNAGSLTIDNAQLSVVGSGIEATAMRVTIATDSTGVLSVDDNGGILTVDGTVILGAGTAEIGKLAAGVANIGEVDVFTIAARG